MGDNYPWISGSGLVSFSAFPLAGPGVDNTNSVASFAGVPGAVSLVARVGSQAPDSGPLARARNLAGGGQLLEERGKG